MPLVGGFVEEVELHALGLADVGEHDARLFVEESFAVELRQGGQGGLDDGGGVGGRGGELDGAAVAVLLQVVAVAVGGEEDGDGLADAVLSAQVGGGGGGELPHGLLDVLAPLGHAGKGAALHDGALRGRAVKVYAGDSTEFAPGAQPGNGEEGFDGVLVAVGEVLGSGDALFHKFQAVLAPDAPHVGNAEHGEGFVAFVGREDADAFVAAVVLGVVGGHFGKGVGLGTAAADGDVRGGGDVVLDHLHVATHLVGLLDGQGTEELVDGILHKVEDDLLLLHGIHNLAGDAAVLLMVCGTDGDIVQTQQVAHFEEGNAALQAKGFGLGGEGKNNPSARLISVGHNDGLSFQPRTGGHLARGEVGVAIDMDEQVDCAVFDCVSVSVRACGIDTLTQSGDYTIRLIRRQG